MILRFRINAAVIAVLLVLAMVAITRAQDAAADAPPKPEAAATQSAAPTDTPAAPTTPSLESLVAELERLTTALDEGPAETKSALESGLNDARAAIGRAREHDAKRTEFERATNDSPKLLETIKAELASTPGEPELGLSASPSVSEVEQAITQAKAELTSAKDDLQKLKDEDGKRVTRLGEGIPTAITESKDRRRDLLDDLAGAAPAPDAPLADQLRRVSLQCDLAETEARLAELDAEQKSYMARKLLLPARQSRVQRRQEAIQGRLTTLQEKLAEARTREASQAAQDAERLSQQAQNFTESSPTLQAVAAENVQLTSELSGEGGITTKLTAADRQISLVGREIEDLRRRFEGVRERVDTIGLTDAVGVILHRELDRLTDARRTRAPSLATSAGVSEAQLRGLRIEDRIDELANRDIGSLLEDIRAELPSDQPEFFRQRVGQIAREAFDQRSANLSALSKAYTDHVDQLATLQGRERELSRVTEAYENYVEERILWARSIIRGRILIRPGDVGNAFRWMFFSPDWLQVPGKISDDFDRSPPTYISLVLLVLVSFALRRPAGRMLRRTDELVSSFRTDRFSHTIVALLCTLLRALPWPLLLFCAGTVLSLPDHQVAVAVAVGAGLHRIAVMLLLIELLRRLIKPNGVGDVHFRWRRAGSKVIRANLAWLVPIALPVVLVRVATQHQPNAVHTESLGRLCFIIGVVALAIFSARVLSPRGEFIRPMLREGGWFDRLRFVWYPLVPGVILALAILPLLGYFYTALQLRSALGNSFWFIFVVIVTYALANRWLFIARRRLAVEHARKAREAAAAAAAAKAQDGEATPLETASVEETVDIPALDQQTRRLFRTGTVVLITFGLFAIWSGVLPALNMLQRVQLWPSIEMVELPSSSIDPILLEHRSARPAEPGATDVAGSSDQSGASPTAVSPLSPLSAMPSSGAGSESAPSAQPRRITLSDLGLAIIVAVITVLAGRNVPGLLEIAFLTKLPLDAGARFAITSIARYLIYMVGIAVAFGAIKVGWAQIQWLAAALTFGLAFGLQEIFANFVSGLIILAERPIRVGDTVTVGPVSGTVTQIQMRATHIRDWDRKEIVIPNKSFITNDITNWTLSDTVMRIVVDVGVAYGSDIALTERLLLEAARQTQFVVDDPEPRVRFLGFGDNSLNFKVYAFLSEIEGLAAKHHLHTLINEKLNAHGVVIAFPQRDIHLDPGSINVTLTDERTKPGDAD